MELLPETEREARDKSDGERVVAVDVENRRLDHLRHVGRVFRRARVGGQRGESDLVVDDDVNGAANFVTRKLREIQHLGDHALTRKRRVAMDEQRQHFHPLLGVQPDALLRPRFSEHDGIHRLEMAWVRCEADADFVARIRAALGIVAEVIFHVAVAADQLGNVVFGKLREHRGERFLQEIRDHVQPPAMRHAHHDFLHAVDGAIDEQRVQDHHQRLAALEAEAFLADVARVQEPLEAFRLHQLFQNHALRFFRESEIRQARLDAVENPIPHVRRLDMHVFHADRVRVNRAQRPDHRAQRHRFSVHEKF